MADAVQSYKKHARLLPPSRSGCASAHGLLRTPSTGGPGYAAPGYAFGRAATIVRHLQSLAVDDAKLYRALGRAALELAQKQGMDEQTAGKVAEALATDLPPVIRTSGKIGIHGRRSPDSR